MDTKKLISYIDYLGYIGPFVLIILSIILLFKLPYILSIYIIGFFFNIIINIILKLIFQQPRPNEDGKAFEIMKANGKRILFDKYGLPSGHSQSCAYSTIFLFMVSLQNLTNISSSSSSPSSLSISKYYSTHFSKWILWVLLFLIITMNTSYQRVKYSNHTLFQVIIGLIVGSIVGYIMFELSQNPEIIGLLKPTSITIEKNSREFFKRFETFFTKNINTNLI